MARPDCPRCGSNLIVSAPSETSEQILELRDGKVPVAAAGGGFDHWLCRSCGHRWDPAAYPDRWVPGPGDPLPDPDGILTDLQLASSEPGSESGPPEVEPSDHAPAGSGAGALLQRVRQERGVALSEISTATKIWERHLQALESDASLEEFPAPAYARFFLREYAEYLQIDPSPLLRRFDARHPPVEESPLEPLPPSHRRTKVVAAVLVVLSIATLVGLALTQPRSEPSDLPSPVASAGAATGGPRDASPPPAPPRTPNGVRAVLHVNAACWIVAVADGEELEPGRTVEPGEVLVYRADRLLQLRLGNAGGVILRVDGEPVATGGPGEVVNLELRWRHGELVVGRA